jgi:hypothetical protein
MSDVVARESTLPHWTTCMNGMFRTLLFDRQSYTHTTVWKRVGVELYCPRMPGCLRNRLRKRGVRRTSILVLTLYFAGIAYHAPQ